MKTFTNCAEKKAKQFLNLLQGYTKGIRMTAILVLLLMGVSNAWGVERIYLKLNTWKTSDGGRYAAYLFNNNGKEYWQNMYETSIANVLACDIPADGITYNEVIFVRLNPSGSDPSNGGNNWNNKWNQSGDITLQKNKLFTAYVNWDSWTGAWSTITWYITGSFNEWKTNNSATSYTLNANTTYEFKVYSPQVGYFSNTGTMVRGNHSNWEMFANVGNCKLTTDIAGTYIFTYNGDKMNVTYPEDCYLPGTFNGWAENAASSLKSGSVTLNLAANTTYTFKIHNFGATSESWHGNTGTMTRANCTNWEMKEDADCKITTDFAGNYTFTYDRSTQKLSVTYPAAYTVTYGVGTNKGTASVTTSPNITSGSFALPSTSITFSKGATKEGYTWKGWYSNAAGTGTNFGNGTTYTSTNRKGDISVYACYDLITYNITYNLNGGTGATNTTYNVESATITLPTAPTKTGYTFAGWYDNTNLTGNKVTQVAKGSTGNKAFWAKWTANQYTITWNANGGSVTPASSTYTYDGDPVALPTPTRTGYEFNGWFTASTGGTRISDVGKTNKPTSNTTYYAQWKAKTYIVTLDPQGGFSGSNSINATYDATLPAITPPTRDGYMFNGYYSQPSGQGTKYYNADGTSTLTWNQENATLYAYWAEYSKCIFFKNTLDWNNVFIYTFSDEVWHNGNDQNDPNDDKGVQPKTNRIEFGQMTKLGETDIYYYILTNTTDGFNRIAFSNANMSGYDEFYKNQAVYRGDRTDQMPLFVPYKDVNKEVNETQYYNEGIWMKYNSKESGYYLNIAGESNTPLVAANAGDYTFTATVYLTPGQRILDLTNLYPDTKFSKEGSLISGNQYILDKWQEYSADSKLSLSTTNEGAYTFTLNLADGQVKLSAAYPSVVVPEAGDYRLLYVEQVVEKSIANGDEWKTIITRKKAHPSDIIKKRTESGVDTVSLHVYNNNTYQAVKNPKATNDEDKYYTSPSNSAVILQQYNGTTWEDKERHMVFKPLETLPSMAMLPGRRNTEGNTTLKYDKGIKVIQEDEKNSGNGVWNFPIAQTVNGSEVTATLERSGIKRYSGKYYIRTANSVGGWNNYTIPENHMTHSLYAESNNEFTHYYCKWIDINKGSRYVQFVVANDFGQAISDTLVADRATLFGVALAEGERMVSDNGLLPASANVRFSWKEDNNALHRAYIDGAGSSKEYLVLKDLDKKLFKFNSNANNLTNDTVTFLDNGGWMYQVDVYSKTNSPINLTAKYNGKVQHFKGEAARATTNLIGGNQEDATKYPIRILYDFKENHLITGYVPQTPETKDVAIETNLMMIRKNHGAANQLTMNINNVGEDGVAVNTGYDAYGVITFTESHLKGSDNWKVTNDKTFYWISFPFDVNLRDAFGFGKYAYHWYIEYYDGKSRAENGLFLDSGTYWEYVMEEDAHDFVLKANQGYVLWLNVAQIQADNFFTEITKEISIYFPSANKIANNFQTKSETVNLPSQRRPEGSRRYTQDSNWRLIGVPSYANTSATTSQGDINFVYIYDANTNKYNVAKSASQIGLFQSMHAYMVQYEGDINWTTVVNEYPSQLAAKQNSNGTKEQHVLRLELQRNGSKEDHTYIQLQDDKATEMFDMNLDLTKMSGSGGNIYSIIPSSSDPIQVAANVMPIEECIIPLGIKTTKATNYTFAMPDGTDGIIVELIDYETNTRTNMLLSDYTVSLPKGTNETRFALHVKPNKVVTGTENIHTSSDRQIKKYIIDGVLYMQKDGVLYDAQGRCVK